MEIVPDQKFKGKLEHYSNQDGPILTISPDARIKHISRARHHLMIHPEADPDQLWEVIKNSHPDDKFVIEEFKTFDPQSLKMMTALGHTSAFRISDIDHTVKKIPIGEQ
jgi:hypothetical protein